MNLARQKSKKLKRKGSKKSFKRSSSNSSMENPTSPKTKNQENDKNVKDVIIKKNRRVKSMSQKQFKKEFEPIEEVLEEYQGKSISTLHNEIR